MLTKFLFEGLRQKDDLVALDVRGRIMLQLIRKK